MASFCKISRELFYIPSLFVMCVVIVMYAHLGDRERKVFTDDLKKTDRDLFEMNNMIETRREPPERTAVEKYDMIESESCGLSCQKDIQTDRLRRVSRVCRNEWNSSSVRAVDNKFVQSLGHMFVLDQYKVLFCYVPKVACTNWKRTLLILTGVIGQNVEVPHMAIHGLAQRDIPTLKKFDTQDAVRRLNEYKKVLFVREPMSRLLSAYRDKLEKPLNPDSKAFRKFYSAKVKGIKLAELGLQGFVEFNASFYDFISYVSNPDIKYSGPGEEHWRTVDDLCKPCQVEYDFIGRMETLARDRDYAIRNIFNTDPKKVQIHGSTNPTNSSKRSLLDQYIADIPAKKLRTLHQTFYIDFAAFGYKSPVD